MENKKEELEKLRDRLQEEMDDCYACQEDGESCIGYYSEYCTGCGIYWRMKELREKIEAMENIEARR